MPYGAVFPGSPVAPDPVADAETAAAPIAAPSTVAFAGASGVLTGAVWDVAGFSGPPP
jgi:hypothetical protein